MQTTSMQMTECQLFIVYPASLASHACNNMPARKVGDHLWTGWEGLGRTDRQEDRQAILQTPNASTFTFMYVWKRKEGRKILYEEVGRDRVGAVTAAPHAHAVA